MDNSNIIKLSDIQPSSIHRYTTGFDELDYVYGHSTFPRWTNGELSFPSWTEWGMPYGKISLWAAESGTGKSRLCIDIVKKWSYLYPTSKILYIMTESPLSDFAAWAKDTSQYTNVYCSSVDKIDTIIDVIYEVAPHLIFIDSVNEIEDFTGTSKSAKRLIKGIEDDKGVKIKIGLKQVVNDVRGHLILLGQLNENKTIKGGTALPHLVDVALDLKSNRDKNGNKTGSFIVKVGIKNRHGKDDASTVFTHTDEGVISACNNRLEDKIWCKSNNIPICNSSDKEQESIQIPVVEELFPMSIIPSQPDPLPLTETIKSYDGWVYCDRNGNPSNWTPEIQADLDKLDKQNKRSLLSRINDTIGQILGFN